MPQSSTSPWPGWYDTVLREYLPLLPRDQPIAGEKPLADQGLDSLATVALLMDIENNAGVSLPDELLTGETFATADSLWRAIDSVRSDES